MVWQNISKTIKRNPRRNSAPEFKAAKGLKTVNQIALENELQPVQVSQCKKKLLDVASAVFERDGTAKKQMDAEARDRARLERKIIQLTLEVDSLTKKSKKLGL